MADVEPAKSGFLDGAGARLLALIILIGSAAMIAYYHRADLLPAQPVAGGPGLNPEFVACRAQRVGQVDRMRADGVIGDAQVESFKARALAFCTDQFPPDKPGQP